MRITVWNEGVHDTSSEMRKRYPRGMHGAIAEGLAEHHPDREYPDLAGRDLPGRVPVHSDRRGFARYDCARFGRQGGQRGGCFNDRLHCLGLPH